MSRLDAVRESFHEAAKDIKLNLPSVMEAAPLTPAQRWGVAVAAAVAARNEAVREAVIEDARTAVDPAVVEDGLAAASLMAMNNVYYRFRHLIGKPGYSQKPAGLRMNRLVKPATNRTDFELICLAVSAINGCEMCLQAHEKVVLEGGLSQDHVADDGLTPSR